MRHTRRGRSKGSIHLLDIRIGIADPSNHGRTNSSRGHQRGWGRVHRAARYESIIRRIFWKKERKRRKKDFFVLVQKERICKKRIILMLCWWIEYSQAEILKDAILQPCQPASHCSLPVIYCNNARYESINGRILVFVRKERIYKKRIINAVLMNWIQ